MPAKSPGSQKIFELAPDSFLLPAKPTGFEHNRPFGYSEKNQNGTVFCCILSNFRMCTILIEAPTPFDRTSRIKCIKITLDPVATILMPLSQAKFLHDTIYLT